MPGKHKNPTISFRVTDYERRAIEANIKMSGILKKDEIALQSLILKTDETALQS